MRRTPARSPRPVCPDEPASNAIRVSAVPTLATALADRYRIDRELGSGGMATVFLADDLRNSRQVAIKVLKPDVAARLGIARFLAEIRTTANLQHPHILPLFDSGEVDGMVFYVMPYVTGESLRDRLNREQQLPVADAVRIAKEVAAALDYAHGRGVVHRDIKPENILLQDGAALVADFGIARAAHTAGSARLTGTGITLGTPRYMSPEQALGERVIDARTDVYALGCVTYEMLAGEPPFDGPSVQAIMARVMSEEPRSIVTYRKAVPPGVVQAVTRALERLPADRFSSAREYAVALDTPASVPVVSSATPTPKSRAWRLPAIASLAALASATGTWAALRPNGTPSDRVTRFTIPVGPIPERKFSLFGSRVAISPDGDTFVYIGDGPNYSNQLWIRRRDDLVARPIAGTEKAVHPFFSPDGKRLAFFTLEPNTIKVVTLGSERIETIAASEMLGVAGGVWSSDGFIYSDANGLGMLRVLATGGTVERVAPALLSRLEIWWPEALPDGNTILFADETGSMMRDSRIKAFDVRRGVVHTLVSGFSPKFFEPQTLLYLTIDGALHAIKFDPAAARTIGEPVTLVRGVQRRERNFSADFAVSKNGSILYRDEGPPDSTDAVWIEPDGRVRPLAPTWEANLLTLSLAPDGKRIVGTVAEQSASQIWIATLGTTTPSRLTVDPGVSATDADFSPDGRWIIYRRSQTSGPNEGSSSVMLMPADGSAAPKIILEKADNTLRGAWASDSRAYIFAQLSPANDFDLMLIHPGTDTSRAPIANGPGNEGSPAVSPDGRWLAYVSVEAGRRQLFVQPYPRTNGARWQISTGDVSDGPWWSANSRGLWYRTSDKLIGVEVGAGQTFAAGARHTVPITTDGARIIIQARASDGRFLAIRRRGPPPPTDITVIDNAGALIRAAFRDAKQ
jgi:eukaryotic-like serine/threonine-protein kinase